MKKIFLGLLISVSASAAVTQESCVKRVLELPKTTQLQAEEYCKFVIDRKEAIRTNCLQYLNSPVQCTNVTDDCFNHQTAQIEEKMGPAQAAKYCKEANSNFVHQGVPKKHSKDFRAF